MTDPNLAAPRDAKVREHELKVWPEFFEALVDGRKTFEWRRDDRDYQVGDVLYLREWSEAKGYSGRSIRRSVSYVLSGHFGVPLEYVVLALAPLPAERGREEAQHLLDLAIGIIETGDQRLLAADGPANGLPPDITLKEWRKLYTSLVKARAALSPDAGRTT